MWLTCDDVSGTCKYTIELCKQTRTSSVKYQNKLKHKNREIKVILHLECTSGCTSGGTCTSIHPEVLEALLTCDDVSGTGKKEV